MFSHPFKTKQDLTPSSTGVISVNSSDSSLTVSPTTGAVDAIVNLSHNFNWLGQHDFAQLPTATTVAPTLPNQLVTFMWLSILAGGLFPLPDSDVATTGNIALTGEQTIDGFLTNTSIVLVWKQTLPAQNGIYVSAAGAWTRVTYYDSASEIKQGTFTYILNGIQNRGKRLVEYQTPSVIGVDPINFATLSELSGDFFGPNSSTDNAIVRFDGTTGKLGQNSTITISDSLGGITTFASPDAIYFNTTSLGYEFEVDSGGAINLYAGTNIGGGQGFPVNISAGFGGPTGIGGFTTITSGDGGVGAHGGRTTIGAGNGGGGTADGGEVWLVPGNKTGAGIIGHVRLFPYFGAAFSANLDTSLVTISDQTFTFQDQTGTLAMLENNLGQFSSTTSAQLASVLSDETGTGLLVFNTSPTFITPVIGVATGTSLAVTGLITSNGTAGIGYATGAGGSVTQLTSKSTPVTLNKRCGRITMSSANLANNAEVSFTLNNSTIAATDIIIPNMASGGTIGGYTFTISAKTAGSCVISVSNVSGGALAQAIVLDFAVIKSVII